MKCISPRPRTEGIINEVTAAILAVVIFDLAVGSGPTPGALLTAFISRLGVGVLDGFVTAATVIVYLLKHADLSASNAVQHARMVVLIGAITTYGIAEGLAPEAGIAAVATAGLLLSNADLPHRENIEAFKGDITLIVLSVVFMSLVTLLSFEDLLSLEFGGLVVVVAVITLIRPVAVLRCTHGHRFTLREQLFMSAVRPRGIIPASVATLFALELRGSNPIGATILAGTVFFNNPHDRSHPREIRLAHRSTTQVLVY